MQRLSIPEIDDLSGVGELLKRLILTPSVNPAYDSESLGENLLVTEIAEACNELGIEYEFQAAVDRRQNLLIKIGAPSESATRTILIEAHSDTVGLPIGEDAPQVTEKGDWIFGRGACDVKGGLAAALVAGRFFHENGGLGGSSLWILCAADEEYKFRGITSFLLNNGTPDLAIVCEPTDLDIVSSHCGVLRVSIEYLGEEAHSSQIGSGRNAIEIAAGSIQRLTSWYFASYPMNERGNSSVAVTGISGGRAINIIPKECIVDVDFRVHPDVSTDQVYAELKEFLRTEQEDHSAPTRLSPPSVADDGLPQHPDTSFADLALTAVREEHPNGEIVSVAFGTDASKLSRAGANCIVFGPGSIKDAHSDFEKVRLGDVARAAQVMINLISQAATK